MAEPQSNVLVFEKVHTKGFKLEILDDRIRRAKIAGGWLVTIRDEGITFDLTPDTNGTAARSRRGLGSQPAETLLRSGVVDPLYADMLPTIQMELSRLVSRAITSLRRAAHLPRSTDVWSY